jgi:hypothetical protein
MRGTAYIAAVLLGTALFGQPRPEGADISGVWNFATLTPLERPAKFATVLQQWRAAHLSQVQVTAFRLILQ